MERGWARRGLRRGPDHGEPWRDARRGTLARGRVARALQSHMTRAFVRQLGITPGRYRAAVA